MANTDITPTVGALTGAGVTLRVGYDALVPSLGNLVLAGSRPGIPHGPVLMLTGLRPEHAWLEGLTGRIVTIRRGGSFRVHLLDTAGHWRAARVKQGEVA